MRRLLFIGGAATLLLAAGCDRGGKAQGTQTATTQPAAAPGPTNRIDIPATVRQNLGITFAKVEQRRVASTIRVPGRFELLQSAKREYRTTLPGWVRLRVGQYDEIKPGAPIFELDSPEWHKLRKQLHESQATIERATAEVAVTERAKTEAETALKVLEKRVSELAGAEVRRADLEADLATRRASIPRLDAEIKVKQASLNEARHDFALEVDAAASLLGTTPQSLTETVPEREGGGDSQHEDGHKVQRWFAISKIGPTAAGAGLVEAIHVTDGSWVDANIVIATLIDPAAIRFRATGLQSDLGRLRDGLEVTVVPPQGSGIDPADVMPAKLKIGIAGDPDQRTIDFMAAPSKLTTWAKPGVSALMEISVESSAPTELAIPLSAVVRDELVHIFYRRDPNNPDKAIRMTADLGISDGKWVVVKSGLKAGDEVVLEGVYELKLAGGGKVMGGGHFHADGTWHAEPDK
jgi:multidrug efflux pump subunit AcrA (membrane-fusion protein)